MGYPCTNCPEMHLAGDGEGCEAKRESPTAATFEGPNKFSLSDSKTFVRLDNKLNIRQAAREYAAERGYADDIRRVSLHSFQSGVEWVLSQLLAEGVING